MPTSKPYHGKKYGCNDTLPPEFYTANQLSRIADMLYAAGISGIVTEEAVWQTLPESAKLEFNYSNWSYEAQRGN